ncbi:hypothetical protein JRO89_XS06G0116300 [Xanthoceras sorbifolium]|uniref:GH18 domain-containing protein n=1 Tax=Xanthoceras sorbifolium TaxID=99658 RepID=A0ABQ8HXT0_9ROSI|nr:hypothetical protein JRO89_XS06G0116300 [Xanthoceras sorbifolium]
MHQLIKYQLSITQFDDQWMSNFTATLHDDAKNNPRPAKAFLSIGGGLSSSYTLSNMAKTTQNRSTFVSSTSQVARKYSFDGLDLDWEFPKNEQEMSNLALLFKQWRAAVEFESELYGKPRLLLSAAVYFSPEFFLSDVPRIYPGVAIRSYVDFVNQMCYDYHGSWDTSVTGEHALFSGKVFGIENSDTHGSGFSETQDFRFWSFGIIDAIRKERIC